MVFKKTPKKRKTAENQNPEENFLTMEEHNSLVLKRCENCFESCQNNTSLNYEETAVFFELSGPVESKNGQLLRSGQICQFCTVRGMATGTYLTQNL